MNKIFVLKEKENWKVGKDVYAPFQQATIKHILDIFQNKGISRVLCADEVGLGKTYVAKGVIRGMAWKRYCEGQDSLNVLYLCSNLNIAEQNKGKLGLEEKQNKNKALENRSSMLYLQILRGIEIMIDGDSLAEEYSAATGIPVTYTNLNKQMAISVLPITPDTSIEITKRKKGCANEREYILRMLKLCGIWDVCDEECTRVRVTKTCNCVECRIKRMVETGEYQCYQEEFKGYEFQLKNQNEERKKQVETFGEKLKEKLREKKELSSIIPDLEVAIASKKSLEVENTWVWLRQAFATVTLQMISYDLVILDEFQNFTKIIAGANSNAQRRNYTHKQRLFAYSILEGNGIQGKYREALERMDDFKEEYDNYQEKTMVRAYFQQKEISEYFVDKSEKEIFSNIVKLCINIAMETDVVWELENFKEQSDAWNVVRYIMTGNLVSTSYDTDYASIVFNYLDSLWNKMHETMKHRGIVWKYEWERMESAGRGYAQEDMRVLYKNVWDEILRTYDAKQTAEHPYAEIRAWIFKKISGYDFAQHFEEELFLRRFLMNLEIYKNGLLGDKGNKKLLLEYYVLWDYFYKIGIADFDSIKVEALEPLREFYCLQHYYDMMGISPNLSDDAEEELLDYIFAEECDKNTKILMLSATPFRFYMGTEETGDEKKEGSKETIETICNFLQRSGKLKTYLNTYKSLVKEYAKKSERLQVQEIDSEQVLLPKTLIDAKDIFEREMTKYFTRFERNAVLRELGCFTLEELEEGGNTEEVVNAEVGNLYRYVDEFVELVKKRTAVVRYAMQMPYALSFMPGSRSGTGDGQENAGTENGYRIKSDFLKQAEMTAVSLENIEFSLLSKDEFKTYGKPMGDFHGVYKDMLYKVLNLKNEDVNKDEPGAGRLLWIPPLTAKCLKAGEQLAGAFDKHYGYGKTILFSSWVLVPRGIAVLFSYEVRRRLLCTVFPGWMEKSVDIRKEILDKIEKQQKALLKKIDTVSANMEKDKNCQEWSKEKISLWKKLLSSDITSILAVWAECAKGENPCETDIEQQFRWIEEYSKNGCLDLVLEEYEYILPKEGRKSSKKKPSKSNEKEELFDYLKATKLKVSMIDVEEGMKKVKEEDEKTFFARGLGSSKDEDSVSAIKYLQQAFNSPFAPFVFATTSIGQEGLDFHCYADQVIHWNLPSNPVDFEQREGRINRRNGFALRKVLIERYANQIQAENTSELFDLAMKKVEAEWKNYNPGNAYLQCGMIPKWILPYRENGKIEVAKIKRVVPYFVDSEILLKYHNNLRVLQLYRSVIGQPDPEELLERLTGRENGKEIVKQLFLDFSPLN